MSLPTPTLDHVVVNVRDRMDEAAALYGRLGFTLTPRGFHTLGSMNHLAIFGTDYLELIGAGSGDTQRPDILEWPLGLNGLVFGTENSAAVYEMLRAAGVPIRKPMEFSRPVTRDGLTRDAVFRTVRLPHEAVAAGRLYFCHHYSRDLVWRDEWRSHANGTVGIVRALIAARDPDVLGGLFRAMFGADAVTPIAGGLRLYAGLTRLDVIAPETLARKYGIAAGDGEGRETWMAGLVLRTRSLAQAAVALAAGGIEVQPRGRGLVVPAHAAFWTMLEFVA